MVGLVSYTEKELQFLFVRTRLNPLQLVIYLTSPF